MPEVNNEVYREKHYSVPEIAKLWNLSKDTARRLFVNEPGVLILQKSDGTHHRRYTTLRIPESVVRRVHLRLSNPSAETAVAVSNIFTKLPAQDRQPPKSLRSATPGGRHNISDCCSFL
jgi:hypothetical protein